MYFIFNLSLTFHIRLCSRVWIVFIMAICKGHFLYLFYFFSNLFAGKNRFFLLDNDIENN